MTNKLKLAFLFVFAWILVVEGQSRVTPRTFIYNFNAAAVISIPNATTGYAWSDVNAWYNTGGQPYNSLPLISDYVYITPTSSCLSRIVYINSSAVADIIYLGSSNNCGYTTPLVRCTAVLILDAQLTVQYELYVYGNSEVRLGPNSILSGYVGIWATNALLSGSGTVNMLYQYIYGTISPFNEAWIRNGHLSNDAYSFYGTIKLTGNVYFINATIYADFAGAYQDQLYIQGYLSLAGACAVRANSLYNQNFNYTLIILGPNTTTNNVPFASVNISSNLYPWQNHLVDSSCATDGSDPYSRDCHSIFYVVPPSSKRSLSLEKRNSPSGTYCLQPPYAGAKTVCPSASSGFQVLLGNACYTTCATGYSNPPFCGSFECTSQSPDCSGCGSCKGDTTNFAYQPYCACYNNYTGSFCEVPQCVNNCNFHGICNANGLAGPSCTCRTGWAAYDCSIGVCATGCNRNGQCNTNTDPPTCACNLGFSGADCMTATCPGNPQCNGPTHGTCDGSTATCDCTQYWTGTTCGTAFCQQDCGAGKCNYYANGTTYCYCSNLPTWNYYCVVPTTSSSSTATKAQTTSSATTFTASTSASASSAATVSVSTNAVTTSTAYAATSSSTSMTSTSATASVQTTSSASISNDASLSSTTNDAATTSSATTTAAAESAASSADLSTSSSSTSGELSSTKLATSSSSAHKVSSTKQATSSSSVSVATKKATTLSAASTSSSSATAVTGVANVATSSSSSTVSKASSNKQTTSSSTSHKVSSTKTVTTSSSSHHRSILI